MENGGRYQKLLFDSVIMVASVTAILYLFGYLYYAAFCNRLSIPCIFTDLSISQCIMGAMIPFTKLIVVFVAFFILSSTIVISKSKEDWIKGVFILTFILITVLAVVTRQEIFVAILSIACPLAILILVTAVAIYPKSVVVGAVSGCIGTIFLIFVYTPYDISPDVVPPVYAVLTKMVVGLLIISMVFYYIKSKKDVIESYIDELKPDNLTKIRVSITLILITCFISMFLGTIDAEHIIDGTSSDALRVDISLKDKDNTPFENKTLILVMLHDDMYYIIEKDGSHPKKPKLYIIPSDQIKMLLVYEKGKGEYSPINLLHSMINII